MTQPESNKALVGAYHLPDHTKEHSVVVGRLLRALCHHETLRP
jgi:hypothetical protein